MQIVSVKSSAGIINTVTGIKPKYLFDVTWQRPFNDRKMNELTACRDVQTDRQTDRRQTDDWVCSLTSPYATNNPIIHRTVYHLSNVVRISYPAR